MGDGSGGIEARSVRAAELKDKSDDRDGDRDWDRGEGIGIGTRSLGPIPLSVLRFSSLAS